MSNNDWIKLYRKVKDSKVWYYTHAQYRVWETILLSVNWDESWARHRGEEVKLKPGQMVTSRQHLVDESRTSKKVVRDTLDKLEKDDMIEMDRANSGTLLTVVNWPKYQENGKTGSSDEGNNEGSSGGSDEGSGEGTHKEGKEGEESKEENTNSISEEAEEIFDYWQRLDGTTTHETNIYQHKKSIDRRLDDFSPKQLCEAIKRLNGLYTGKYDTWLTTKWSCRDFMKTKSGEHIEKMLKSFEHFLNDSANSNNEVKKQFEEDAD